MKRYLILAGLFGILLAACTNQEAASPHDGEELPPPDEEMEPVELTSAFPLFITWLQRSDSTFNPDFFEYGVTDTREGFLTTDADTAALRPFLPYLIYNYDSSLALDIVSYNYIPVRKGGQTVFQEAGPDTEAALINFKTGKRKRLLFFGTMGIISDARWYDDKRAVIAGAMETTDSKAKPSIWIFDVDKETVEVYNYPGMVNADLQKYPLRWNPRQ